MCQNFRTYITRFITKGKILFEYVIVHLILIYNLKIQPLDQLLVNLFIM